MWFEWDENKNIKNKKKHGISFELASLVFHDPSLLSVLDKHSEEERWQGIGQVEGCFIYVVYLVGENEHGEEIIRIISARKTTFGEERRYYLNR